MNTTKSSVNPQLLFACTMICVGQSLLFGYNLGILNQPVNLIRDFLADCYSSRRGGEFVPSNSRIVNVMWSLTNWSLFVGGLVGASVVGVLSDKFGRRYAMAVIQVFSIGGALVFLAGFHLQLPELLVASRIITGIHFGFSGSFAALYLSEIAPLQARGSILICHHVLKSLGICISSLVGLKSIFGTPTLWPYSILMNAIPSVMCLCAIPFLEDSPRHLLFVSNDRKGAEKALRHYRCDDDVLDEIMEIEKEIEHSRKESFSVIKVLKSRDLRSPLSIGIMLHVIQQFCGINGVFFYSVGIFTSAGVHPDNVQYAVLGTSSIFVIAVLLSIPLLDRIGRKQLMIYPMIIMAIALAGLTFSLNFKNLHWTPYFSIIMIFLYVSGFSFGLGGIPTMISAELFLQDARAHAMSIIGICLLLSVLAISVSFEHIQALLGDQTFVLFIILLLLFIVYVHYKVPETKNRTFEDISEDFIKVKPEVSPDIEMNNKEAEANK